MDHLCNKFEKMGVRARIAVAEGASISVNIRRDREGEYFDVLRGPGTSLTVLDLRPRDRHLLLYARTPEDGRSAKFLCGHDERHWFVAAIPEKGSVTNVAAAMDALKPAIVRAESERANVRYEKRNRRRTPAFVRQGEWFFLPRPNLKVDPLRILHNEPIRRGAGKPHLCEFLCRGNGQMVFVNTQHPNGITVDEFRRLPDELRRRGGWRQMMRNADVYVRGAVRHPDHKTLHLRCWHRVAMNTEWQATGNRFVAFLD